jgi:hypothetical protein
MAQLGVDQDPCAAKRRLQLGAALLQQRWRGEDFKLFLDSHHRFAEGWDTTVVALWRALREAGHENPIVTGYLPSYHPAHDPERRE